MFQDGFSEHDITTTDADKYRGDDSPISTQILNAFSASDIPFWGCDFDTLYPELQEVIPTETIKFDYKDLDTLIACEMICAAICHQMNWDYLRQAVLKKSTIHPYWITPAELINISETTIEELLSSYAKIERIRACERATLLHDVGLLANKQGGFKNIFFAESGDLLPESCIREKLLECKAFSQDPEEKKLQLLFQKLSNYSPLSSLASICKPAVDYHLVRCFLRRGLIVPKNKKGSEFIASSEIQRKEHTMGALRKLCSLVVMEISNYTELSISSINQIEWHIGRSICKEGTPDCELNDSDGAWAKAKYDKCPFYTTCCAKIGNPKLLHIDEPTYKGSSY